jgi:hypothetical protein
MSSVRRRSSGTYRSAADWPSWTDEVRYGIGPTPEDARWWAEQNEDHDADGPPDDLLDALADEAAALDRIERGHLL